MSAKGYWIAFTIGVAAGAGVALLYAPSSGASTRKKLRDRFDDASDYVNDAGDYLRAQAERLSSEAQAVVERSKGHFGDAMDSAADYASGATKRVKSMV